MSKKLAARKTKMPNNEKQEELKRLEEIVKDIGDNAKAGSDLEALAYAICDLIKLL